MHEENSEKIFSLRDRLGQLKFIAKMKNDEKNEEVGHVQDQLKTVMEELGQNTTAVSKNKGQDKKIL